MTYTVISSNSPETAAAVEPVLINRSGLAVAPVDLQSTGGLTAEAALISVASSRRPESRAFEILAERFGDPVGGGVHSPARSSNVGGSDGSDDAAPRPRQLPSSSPGRSVQRSAPAAGPSYLHGVFR